jgi:alpha-ketoglutarate-dependent taurine dioxygenase
VRALPLSPALGASVEGLDLSQPFTPAEEDALRALMASYRLLLFRGQSIDVRDHVRLGRVFGPVLEEERKGTGYVSNVRPGGFVPEGVLWFHSDLAFTSEPCLGLSLYALDVPAACPTVYANAARAATLLPDDLRAEVSGRSALHLYDLAGQAGDVRYREASLGPEGPLAPRYAHPVLLTHPVTGDDVLYVSRMQTGRILGVDDETGEDLVARLFDVLYDESNTYRHDWSVGDIVVWDNIALQHSRPVPPPHVPRTLHRVAIAARSIFELVPGFEDYLRARDRVGA